MRAGPTTRRRLLGGTCCGLLAGLAGCSSSVGTSSDGNASDTPQPTRTAASPKTTAGTTTSARKTDAALQGPKQGDSLPEDATPDDGYPPTFETVPSKRSIDTGAFGTVTRNDIEVTLVPVDVAYYWYARGEARFADARSESEYDVAHIFGAVLSPASGTSDDPVAEWPKADRVVTYCDCPHYLSSVRAAALEDHEFEEVFAIDEGLGAWRDRNYPVAGNDLDRNPKTWTIEGDAGTDAAGGTAWAYHVGSDQTEATRIEDDGTYTLEATFVDVTADSNVRIETPAYELTATLGELSSGHVSASGRVVGADGKTTGTETNDAGTETETATATTADDSNETATETEPTATATGDGSNTTAALVGSDVR